MFKWWWRVRDGTLSRELFAERMADVIAEVGRLLREARDCNQSKTAGTARHILKIEDALWTFVYTDDVEPTNNVAERTVRKGVMWRKTSFGTQAERGSRFVERMLTVVETCRCQGRDVLGYVTAAVQAATAGRPPPSLLPARDTVIDLS
jgi:transposase